MEKCYQSLKKIIMRFLSWAVSMQVSSTRSQLRINIGITGSGFASISVKDRLTASVSNFSSEVAYYFVPDTQRCGTKPRFILDLKLDSSPSETLWNLSDADIIISQVVLGNVAVLANMFITVDKCIDAVS
jgi:hypothetical protein